MGLVTKRPKSKVQVETVASYKAPMIWTGEKKENNNQKKADGSFFF